MASWIVRDRIISFSSVGFLFFFLWVLSVMRYIKSHIKGSGIFRYLHAVLVSSPANGTYWQRAPCYGWVTDCGAKCPKHTFSPQIAGELFFLNDWPLPRYWLTVCTRFGEIHLKAVQCCCVRQEASVLALRVIHSVSRTQRGLSSLVSLLLAFKECACVCVDIMYMHRQEFACARAHACICPCSNTG